MADHPEHEILDQSPPSIHPGVAKAPSVSYTFYFGGELFSGKHLVGNAMLAEMISQLSQGKYRAVLPQNIETREYTPHGIRDTDIDTLLSCDLCLFNYDGPELDSGTVIEFMFAKFADMPSILLRSDFRNAGDQAGEGDPWNLMSSHFPRATSVVLNAMKLYKDGLKPLLPAGAVQKDTLKDNSSSEAAMYMIEKIAKAVITAFDHIITVPPVLPASSRDSVYSWLALMPNLIDGGEEQIAKMLKLCAAKAAKGLL